MIIFPVQLYGILSSKCFSVSRDDKKKNCNLKSLDILLIVMVSPILQIDDLARISDSPSPSVTRILYTEKDVEARR